MARLGARLPNRDEAREDRPQETVKRAQPIGPGGTVAVATCRMRPSRPRLGQARPAFILVDIGLAGAAADRAKGRWG
jgi:hypothetical protein